MAKNAVGNAQKFAPLLKKIMREHAAEPPEAHDAVTQLIIGFLSWNASRRQAQSALNRISQTVVEHNDLRVSLEHEIVEMLGEAYPLAQERAVRLREALHAVFADQHTLSLDALADRNKKEVRAYLDDLPGTTQYVAAHVTLICFEGHAVPVDDRLAEALRHEGVVDADADVEHIGSFLERQIRAGSTLEACSALQAWVDAGTRRATLVKEKGVKKTAARK
jgi:endonuclease III